MIKSMTGFGSGKGVSNGIEFFIEVRAVNTRFLDFNFQSPRSCANLENIIRQKVRQECKRGNIQVSIFADSDTISTEGVPRFDRKKYESYMSILKTIHQEYGEDIRIADIIDIEDLLLSYNSISLEEGEVLKVLGFALKELDEMRSREGRIIAEDLKQRIEYLIRTVERIEKDSQENLPRLKEEYRAKIDELIKPFQIDDSRILQEASILAEKSDITEECVRCKSHLNQFQILLEQEEPVGKKLNFLLQEINREVNTIGSKANQLDIIQTVIDMKDEVEKIREQVQNVL